MIIRISAVLVLAVFAAGCHSASSSTDHANKVTTIAATAVTAGNLAGTWVGTWVYDSETDTDTLRLINDSTYSRSVESVYTDHSPNNTVNTSGTWGLSGDTLTLTNGSTIEAIGTVVLLGNRLYLGGNASVFKGQASGTSIVNTWTSNYTQGTDTYRSVYTFDSSGHFSWEYSQPGSDTTSSGTYTVGSDGTVTLKSSSATQTSPTEIATTANASYLLTTNGSGTLEATSFAKQ